MYEVTLTDSFGFVIRNARTIKEVNEHLKSQMLGPISKKQIPKGENLTVGNCTIRKLKKPESIDGYTEVTFKEEKEVSRWTWLDLLQTKY